MAQIDYFLKIASIDGESADAKHKGEIEVESFSWGETASAAGAGHGSGGAAGKVQPQDFHFVKKLDKSSPVLMVGCATGQHFKTAILSGRKAGKSQQDYLKITMDDVLISSYQVSGSAGDVVPTDQVSFNFAKLELSIKEQKADGSVGAEVKQKYDFAANKKV
jgi:type VI secretion system secreted protein Hcp